MPSFAKEAKLGQPSVNIVLAKLGQPPSPNLYTSTYGIDGEGRPSTLKVNSQSSVSGTAFNAASQPTNIAIGTETDYDGYAYDPNTGRMTNWTYQVKSVQETATLTWNPIGTLKSLAITDGFNSGGAQTCNFGVSGSMGYDDWNRLLYDSCGSSGSIWNQTYSYDEYDNLAKGSSGFVSWNPGYSSTTNQYTCTGCTYDSAGDVTNDGTSAYAWNEYNKMQSVNGSGTNCASGGECIVYDAFGRSVEIDSGGASTEIWYTQLGKTAYMNGATYSYAYWPAPGGATVLDKTGGFYYFEHKDWLGNARISSSIAGQSIIDDRAFAPYGEVYDEFGSTATNETIFTGLTQDVIAGMYDTPNRELQGAQQGRWLSPDPARAGWNQYAYVQGMPLQFTDPSGTFATTFGTPFPLYHNFFQACDSDLNPTCFNDCTLDGMYSPCSMAYQSLEAGAAVQCPNNACSDINSNGQFAQFIAGAGGAQGYVSLSNIAQGLNEVNGQFLTNSQYQAYLQATYASQIAGQYNRILANLLALFGGAASADPNDPNIVGGHANFDYSCSDWSVCGPGRYDDGIHVECASGGYGCDPGDTLVVHDDTVSPWISPATFLSSFPTILFSGNFWEHGFVDLIGGALCNCVFSQ